MILRSVIITQPESEPVDIEDVKAHLKVDGSDEDDFILSKMKSARRLCEEYTNLSFITQERAVYLDKFPCGVIEIPNGPVQSIDEINYYDSDGAVQTLDVNTDFLVDTASNPARVWPVSHSWPTAQCRVNAVTIPYTAGYTNDDHDAVPEEIKEAIYKTVSRLYEKRGDGDNGPVLSSEITDILDMVKVYYNANV